MKRVQLIRGNTAAMDAFTGNEGEITYDSQTKELRAHDGTTPGGLVIPNVGTIPTLERKVFSDGKTFGVAGAIPVGDIDKFLVLNAAGTFSLPDRSLLARGNHFYLYAAIAGITVESYDASQQIGDLGALSQTRSMNQYETIHIALLSLAGTLAWRVLSSY